MLQQVNNRCFNLDIIDFQTSSTAICPTAICPTAICPTAICPTAICPTTTILYTAYLGKISVNTFSNDYNTVSLEKIHYINNIPIIVKVIDSNEHNIKVNKNYTLKKLENLSSKKINIKKNKYHYILTLLTIKKIYQLNNELKKVTKINKLLQPLLSALEINKIKVKYPELMSITPTKSLIEYKKIYQQVIQYNIIVDIFYNTCNYLDFLFETTNMVGLKYIDSIISVTDTQNLNNILFTGKYMMYGSSPIASPEVIGHELSNILIGENIKLKFKENTITLNKKYANILGTMFEFYMYEKHPDLLGKKDWLM